MDPDRPPTPTLEEDVVTGVAFSGGGSRAAASTIGAVRALTTLGLWDKIDAVSSISGSLFVTIPWMFADENDYSKKHELKDKNQPMFGRPVSDLSTITREYLDWDTSPIGSSFSDGWGPAWGMVKAFGSQADGIFGNNAHNAREFWKNLMAEQFLHVWGLDGATSLLAASAEHAEQIKNRNPGLKNFHFHTPVPGRPGVFLMGGVLLNKNEVGDDQDAQSLAITPDFTGVPVFTKILPKTFTATAPTDADVGGYYIETFAFGGDDLSSVVNTAPGVYTATLPSNKRAFTLADAMAICTYAGFLGTESIFGWTPDFPYPRIGKANADNYRMGDGGYLEDLGLGLLLQRGATRIAVHLWTGPGQSLKDDFCSLAQTAWVLKQASHHCQGSHRDLGRSKSTTECQSLALTDEACGDTMYANGDECFCISRGQTCTPEPSSTNTNIYEYRATDWMLSYDPNGQISSSIWSLHQIMSKSKGPALTGSPYGYDDGTWHKSHNAFFKKEDLFRVGCALQSKKSAGKPIVAKVRLETVGNDYWGIVAGKTVDILYHYVEKCPEFEGKLPADTQKYLNSDSKFKGFPNEIATGLHMYPAQLKMLAAQAEYAILQNADLYGSLFN